ncbi:hypothetical protein ACVWVQ_001577 [Thermostichus sp. MS-CIW-36]
MLMQSAPRRSSERVRAFSSPELVSLGRTKQARTSRLVYGSPQERNYVCTIQVRIPFPSTVPTLKLLPTAILLRNADATGLRRVGMDVQTPVAGLRRVGRRNKNQRNPCNPRLVFQKLT